MDYEKKYKEALERLQAFHRDYDNISNFVDVKRELESIFPELRESEDERIRSCIGLALTDVNEQRFKDFGITLKDCLSWLEKQKEFFKHGYGLYYYHNGGFTFVARPAEEEKQEEQKHAPDDLQKAFEAGQTSIVDNPEQYGLCKKAEWSEKDKDILKRVIAFLAEDKTLPEWKLYVQKLKEWLKSLPERFELKPTKEWDEDDEDRIRQIERIAQQAGCTQKLQEEIHDWLKSLRPQPKQEWSKEDERILKGIIGKIDHDQTYGVSRDEMLNFLKKL